MKEIHHEYFLMHHTYFSGQTPLVVSSDNLKMKAGVFDYSIPTTSTAIPVNLSPVEAASGRYFLTVQNIVFFYQLHHSPHYINQLN